MDASARAIAGHWQAQTPAYRKAYGLGVRASRALAYDLDAAEGRYTDRHGRANHDAWLDGWMSVASGHDEHCPSGDACLCGINERVPAGGLHMGRTDTGADTPGAVATPGIDAVRPADCRYCIRYGRACGRVHTLANRASWSRAQDVIDARRAPVATGGTLPSGACAACDVFHAGECTPAGDDWEDQLAAAVAPLALVLSSDERAILSGALEGAARDASGIHPIGQSDRYRAVVALRERIASAPVSDGWEAAVAADRAERAATVRADLGYVAGGCAECGRVLTTDGVCVHCDPALPTTGEYPAAPRVATDPGFDGERMDVARYGGRVTFYATTGVEIEFPTMRDAASWADQWDVADHVTLGRMGETFADRTDFSAPVLVTYSR